MLRRCAVAFISLIEMEPRLNILVADDQAHVLEALRLLFAGEGWHVLLADSPEAVMRSLEGHAVDIVLMDLNYSRDTTSGTEGIDLLGRIAAEGSAPPVVVMTAWGSVDGAVEAMRRGARDYVEKPWNNDRLLATLRTQAALGRALRRAECSEQANQRLRDAQLGSELVTASPAMAGVLELALRVAPSDANVLVTGEHGVGKELVAAMIHRCSGRKDRPWITLNAGGLADGVLDSELFGHVKGAFTDAKAARAGCFELAHEGTLFLDEIGNMPSGQQAKLLRVLQTGELRPVGASFPRHVDVRIVSATNVDLAAAARGGQFREDLFYRLNTVEIRIPALRERPEDIPMLAQRFVERFARKYGRPGLRWGDAALRSLLGHLWPGNVRELEHASERAVLLARGDEIGPGDLMLARPSPEMGTPHYEHMTLDQAERALIERALERCANSVKDAADQLGVSRSALYRRLQQYGGELP